MKQFCTALCLSAVFLAAANFSAIADGQEKSEEKSKTKVDAPAGLESVKDRASYAIGANIGRDLLGGELRASDVSLEQIVRGLRDAFAGGKTKLTDNEARAAITAFQRSLQEVLAERRKQAEEKNLKMAENNLKEGLAFLKANKARKGVITRPSGLQYEVIKAGRGATPKKTDKVQTHYHGTLIDGTVFDSSVEREEPSTFPVTGVIKGWVEALQIMKTGDKWRLFIPADLAYGANPRPGGPIGPNVVLIFEIELLRIIPPAETLPRN